MAKNVDWKEIAKMIGVEIGESFRIQIPTYLEEDINKANDEYDFEEMDFCICEDGLALTNEDANIDDFFYNIILGGILHDIVTIVRKRFKPKFGDKYYYINMSNDEIVSVTCSESHFDLLNILFGNCFRTTDEAMEKAYTYRKAFNRKIEETEYEYI